MTNSWLLASIPITSAVVGWATNWLALKMTFYPLEFWGIPCKRWPNQPIGIIGWQGIIPAKAAQMAYDSVDLMRKKLFSLAEIFQRIDPVRVSQEMAPGMRVMLGQILDEVATAHASALWSGLPKPFKEEVIQKAMEEAPVFMTEMMNELGADIHKFYDMHDMVVGTVVADKTILNDIFLRVGKKEFRFIENSGLVFGFLFGLVQLLVFAFYDAWWILPTFGFIVGFATNYIALYLLFKPVQPRIVCGRFTYQGVFLKRQIEVAETHSQVVTERLLTSENMWDGILHGRKAGAFHRLLQKHAKTYTQRLLGPLRHICVLYFGEDGYDRVLDDVATKTSQRLPEHIHLIYKYSDEALDLRRTIQQAMQDLTPAEFEGVLHPVFEQDEIKLILAGAGLGCIVGFLQFFVVFAL